MGPQQWWRDWRWLLRRNCRGITRAEKADGPAGDIFAVTLCRRARWHRGECR